MPAKGELLSREPGELLPDGTLITLKKGTLVLGEPIASGSSAFVRQSTLMRPGERPKTVATKIFRNIYQSGLYSMMPEEPDNEAKIQLFLSQKLQIPHILPLELYETIRETDGFQLPQGVVMPEIHIPESGMPLLVMMLAKSSLYQHIHNIHTQLDPSTITSAIGGVAYALEIAHQHNIVHGDVKPENILLGDEWMLGDFGNAIEDKTGEFFLHAPVIRISLPYAAPERFVFPNVGPKTDQYSTAVVLFKAVTESLPFPFVNEYAHPKIFKKGPPKLKKSIKDRDRLHTMLPFEPAIRKGMHWDEEKRYPDMGSFRADVVEAGEEASKRAPKKRRLFWF